MPGSCLGIFEHKNTPGSILIIKQFKQSLAVSKDCAQALFNLLLLLVGVHAGNIKYLGLYQV